MEQNASSERSNALGELVDSVNVFAESSEKSDEVNTDDEQAGVLACRAENEIIAASLDLMSPANTAAEAPMSSATLPVRGDSLEKKDRDAMLIMLSNQRRRRRARQGY